MKQLSLVFFSTLLICSFTTPNNTVDSKRMNFTEKDILEQLDLAFNQIPSSYYPIGKPADIKYNFFLDLESGYCEIASSRIHLYADSTRWAIVFETSGYETRGFDAQITLNYVGNCINYPINKYPDRDYINNSSNVLLISTNEFEKISNCNCANISDFELISPNANEVSIRNNKVKIEHDSTKYKALGISFRKDANPNRLVGFIDFLRYLNETNPVVISATDDEIRNHIPIDLPLVMTINEFHFESIYNRTNLPSKQETYQLLAKVLLSRDSTLWKPTLKANNNWRNWNSGSL